MLAVLKSLITAATLDLKLLLDDYHTVAYAGNGYPPSGADVIGQLYGHLVFFHKEVMQLDNFNWPFNDCGFCLLHTGNKVQTHQHLQTIGQFDSQILRDVIAAGKNSLLSKNSLHFANAIQHYQEALRQQGLQADATQKLLNRIQSHTGVLAAKGCGALGADVIFVLLENQYYNVFMDWAATEFKVIYAGNKTENGVQAFKNGNPVAMESVYGTH